MIVNKWQSLGSNCWGKYDVKKNIDVLKVLRELSEQVVTFCDMYFYNQSSAPSPAPSLSVISGALSKNKNKKLEHGDLEWATESSSGPLLIELALGLVLKQAYHHVLTLKVVSDTHRISL